MGKTLTQKVIEPHIMDGKYEKGSEIGILIDATLTQDATGTLAYLQFEAMGIPKVQTEISVSYVDHNTLQSDFRNMDDHLYLQSVAAKHGIWFSRPGNGICHQVNLERFGKPGRTLLGSDSHTPTGGGIGMIAIGAGGLDVACAMAGEPFYLKTPKVIGVKLTGKLNPWVSAKDVILEILRIKTVKGGVGAIFEYFGPGVKSLSVPERATITNMGAELGATTSIFPSDEMTKEFLTLQQREHDYIAIEADKDADYDEVIEIELSKLSPMASCPHSPDLVQPITELEDISVDQVVIGSCTNSSYRDLWIVGQILNGKTIARNTSLLIAPGSKQVFSMISKDGTLTKLIDAGARILESACGPCIGMGAAPNSKAISLRTFNRNFEGRSGTPDAGVYLVSPEVAAIAALNGRITDPRDLGTMPQFKMPSEIIIDDRMIIPPSNDPNSITIKRGPGIKPLPEQNELPASIDATVIIKTGDNITTDHIMPAGAKVLPFRSDIPKISEFVFERLDPDFHKKAKAAKTGVIVAGENYGQGSSREHAALAPKYLGIQAVIVKSFARIHKANLINFGIVPLEFKSAGDYDLINTDSKIHLPHIKNEILSESDITGTIDGKSVSFKCEISKLDREIIISGGKLAHVRIKFNNGK
ncbi:MAG: aconitate hydratase [Spirochaetes bacterium GWF1_31_7]|nr:MAG: aconitate hydratase [Spirochaetes bacterium GWE1_32_154]OHD51452.1 MAG: aconitate hydratase [Spirochaetes bacterium GWF1_31_7]HBD93333.1 aconitate hydratase [Spirochaetia bacterium]HBI36664.1 aconitate hydratase [Spirochaetia bacterium]